MSTETQTKPRPYVTTAELAAELDVHPITLVKWRREANRGPRFVRLSRRAVRYARADINAWIESNSSMLAAA
jgi:transposase-like protein